MYSIDRFDDEANQVKQKKERPFTVNFKKIYNFNQELLLDNGIRDEHYPKDILLKMLLGIWIGATVCLSFSAKALVLATLPFLFFYMMAFASTYKVWKAYKYKKGQFWLISLAGIAVSIAIAICVQMFVLKF